MQQIANEALSKAEEYKQILIDNGLLKEPVSQDKINNQILEQLNNLSMQLTKLNSEVAEIKRSGANEYNASIINNKQSKNTASSKADAGTAAATSTVTLTHSTDHKKWLLMKANFGKALTK